MKNTTTYPLSVGDLTAYLRKTGWQLADTPHNRLLEFHGPHDVVLVVPNRDDYIDTSRRLMEAVQLLSQVEDREPGRIVHAILALDRDIDEKCPKCHCPLYNWPHDGDPGLPRNHEIGGKHCLERQLSASEAENSRLREIVAKLHSQAFYVDHTRDWPDVDDLIRMIREAAEAAKEKK